MSFEETTRYTLENVHFLLETKGYPQKSLMFRQALDAHLQPRITVVDIDSKRILAFIESNQNIDQAYMNKVAGDYSAYLLRSKLQVPVYLFTESEHNKNTPRIFQLAGKQGWEQVDEKQFPDYETLQGVAAAQGQAELTVERTIAIDDLKVGAYLVAIVFLSLFVLSVWKQFNFTKEQLLLLAGASFVMALPHYAKIKISGIELERMQRNTGRITNSSSGEKAANNVVNLK